MNRDERSFLADVLRAFALLGVSDRSILEPGVIQKLRRLARKLEHENTTARDAALKAWRTIKSR